MEARAVFLVLGIFIVIGCGGGGGGDSGAGSSKQASGNPNIRVAWVANREAAVNAPGGGYRVYFSVTPNFALAGAPFEDVPYAGGAAAPTQTGLALAPGSYFIKVVAYSALNRDGSDPSEEVSIVVPADAATQFAAGAWHD